MRRAAERGAVALRRLPAGTSQRARTRVLERLNLVTAQLPQGVTPTLGPDATGVGQIFWYTLESDQMNLRDLRTLQDWFVRYQLNSVPGVAEVAPLGGFVKQYQVNVDPNALLAYDISVDRVVEAVRQGNSDVGGRLVEFSGREYMVRGRGYVRSVDDIENIVVGTNMETRTPILVKHVGRVVMGPDLRRGVAELDGRGETVGAVVIMRSGEDALSVIERVRKKIREIEPSLPSGVKLVTTYDRGDDEVRSTAKPKVMILGGGPNRIGQGIEFDYCCVQAALALRDDGFETIMVNSNPETVSTDFDISDKLYFEPLTLEDVPRFPARPTPPGHRACATRYGTTSIGRR